MKLFKSYFQKIVTVEAERVTDSSVWINGKRSLKATSYECYHETWIDAKQRLVDECMAEVTRRERSLQYAKDALAKVEALQESDCKTEERYG